jgi:hypothetical protein
MGRTARQGEKGDYRMILLLKDLEKVGVNKFVVDEYGKNIYYYTNQVRQSNFSNFFQTHIANAEKAKKSHEDSLKF